MRVRLTLDKELNDLISLESKKYKLSINGLINKVISSIDSMKIISYGIKSKNNIAIDVKINTKNEYIWMKKLIENKDLSSSEILRGCIAYYFMLSTEKREKVIYNEQIKKIESSIDRKISVKIKYRKENEEIDVRKIDAYGIFHTKIESHLYLIAFCHKRKNVRTFKLSRIESLEYCKEPIIERKECLDVIENAKKYFDSFLSYGQYVKIRFDSAGMELLKKIEVNRPKEIEKKYFYDKFSDDSVIILSKEELEDKNIKIFECSEYQCRVYFYQFLDSIYILEPKEYREKMIKKFKQAIKVAEGGFNNE